MICQDDAASMLVPWCMIKDAFQFLGNSTFTQKYVKLPT
jgi:hypothetical protein